MARQNFMAPLNCATQLLITRSGVALHIPSKHSPVHLFPCLRTTEKNHKISIMNVYNILILNINILILI